MGASARLNAPLSRAEGSAPPLFRRRSPAVLVIPAYFVASAGLSFAALGAAAASGYVWTPPRAVAAALSFLLLLSATSASRPLGVSRAAMLLVALVLPSLTFTGIISQYTVDGRPVLAGSELHRALSLYDEALADLSELESQRYLLELPRPQARGVPDEYRSAAQRSRSISERWNPASRQNDDLPGQGFEPVLEALNVAADSQSDALTLYIQNAESPQPEIESASRTLAASSGAILSDSLPGLLSDARAGSLALLSGSP